MSIFVRRIYNHIYPIYTHQLFDKYCINKKISQYWRSFRLFSTPTSEKVRVVFVDSDGEEKAIEGEIGSNVLQLAKDNDIDLEGACEGSCACSTCHVYVDQNYLKHLQPPSIEEEDMLDLAPALKENSRLGCQIVITKEMNGIVFTVPPLSRNFYVDGKKH